MPQILADNVAPPITLDVKLKAAPVYRVASGFSILADCGERRQISRYRFVFCGFGGIGLADADWVE
jgi:hypothetical protein